MAFSAEAVLAQGEPAGESHTTPSVAGQEGVSMPEGKTTEATHAGGTEAHAEVQPDNPILPTPPELAWGAGAFLVLWVLMKFVLVKPLVKTMQDRSDKVRGDLDGADQTKSAAVAALAEYEASLASARVEASRIIDDARAQADLQRKQIVGAAEAEVGDLRSVANAEVTAAKQAALADLRASVATIAVQAAEAVVQKRLDAGAQRAIIDDYLNRASQN